MILVIDNYDSFTYNLVQYLGELGADVHVHRNDAISLEQIGAWRPEKIVISPGPGRLAARERTAASRSANSAPSAMPGDMAPAMSAKTFRYSSRYRSRGARPPRSHCGIIFTRPWWAATSSPVSRAALRSSRAIRGTSQPWASRHRRKVSLVTSVNARILANSRSLVRSGSLPFAPSVSA